MCASFGVAGIKYGDVGGNNEIIALQPSNILVAPATTNNMNINGPENPNAILRMEVELRDKSQPAKKPKNKPKIFKENNFENVQNAQVAMEKVNIKVFETKGLSGIY